MQRLLLAGKGVKLSSYVSGNVAPQKFFGSSLHRVQISQVQFQEDGSLASLFFEFSDGEVGLSLTTASDVNLGIVLKEGLGAECYNFFFEGFNN